MGQGITVSVTGLTLGGSQAGDYTLTQPTTTANITAADADGDGHHGPEQDVQRQPHGGAAWAWGRRAWSGVYSGRHGDAGHRQRRPGTFVSKDVGQGITVSVTGLTIGGSQSGDYTLAQPTTTANITAARLTVTGITAADKTYNASLTATLGHGVRRSWACMAGHGDAGHGAGRRDVCLPGRGPGHHGLGDRADDRRLAEAGDYTLTQPTTTANITAAPLTITASPRSKTYGTVARPGDDSLHHGVLLYSDTVTGVTLASSGAAATATVSGSPYTITASAATGSGLGNYSITYVAGNLTVNPAPLTITASPQSKTYGAAPEPGDDGLHHGHALQRRHGDGRDPREQRGGGDGRRAPARLTPSLRAAATGTGLANYTITYATGVLTVSPAPVVWHCNPTSPGCWPARN